MNNQIIKFKVRKERVGPILGRHPWIFSGAIIKIPDGIVSGTPVHITDEKGIFLASGYFNSYSQIAVRVWGYDEKEEINKKFFVQRIRAAKETRIDYLESSGTDSYRLINGENDLLPGLVVDRYADYLVVQFHTQGMELYKEMIVEALEEIMRPKGIYEKSEASYRKKEGLEKQNSVLKGKIPEEIVIKENGLKFAVNVKKGQKTGFFLDQRDKRQALQKYVKDKNVLNCFSYTGGFSVYALAAGALSVTSVDSSEAAMELAKKNVEINDLDPSRCSFICADVKKYLENLPVGKFDVIILDPPAFIKDRHKKKEGIYGYKNLNDMALKILPQNGILATCSCSAHLSVEEFRYLLSEAGGKTKKTMQILEAYTHGIDHPALVPFTEGEYLKCFIVKIL